MNTYNTPGQPYNSTPFVTRDTDIAARGIFQNDLMINQLQDINSSVQFYAEKTEKRLQEVEKKKRRSCTQRYLSQCKDGRTILVEEYDDGTREAKEFFSRIYGTWAVKRVKFVHSEEISSKYIIFFSSGVWVMGSIKKNTETAIYREFIKAGIIFDTRNTVANVKKVLYDTFAPAITNCTDFIEFPELPGWHNGKFLDAGDCGIACPKDFLELPIFEKRFARKVNESIRKENFIKLLKNIRRTDDRVACITILSAGIMASILRSHGFVCQNFINFIILDPSMEKEIIRFFAVYNRNTPSVIAADGTQKEIAKALSEVNDEVIILDAMNADSYYRNQKKDNELQAICRKVLWDGSAYRIRRDISAALVVLSYQVSELTGAINLFVDKEFWLSDYVETESVQWFLAALVNYIEKEYERIDYLITQEKNAGSTSLKVVWTIIERFFAVYGIEIRKELQILDENPFGFLNEIQCDKDELIRMFVLGVRKNAKNFFIKEKVRSMNFDEESIFVGAGKIWILTKNLNQILARSGLESKKHQLLAELKHRGKLYTDAEGLSVKVQVGGIRQEAYVFAEDLFDVPGCVPFVSLGKE